MTDAIVIRPTRVFKMGAIRLADPDPTLAPAEAVRLYEKAYPHLAHAELGEPQLIGEELQFPIKTHDVKTKG
ncbi:PRTRC system protein C [Methylomonas sp. UP202]|uniref:PRTRC system protein C n=1 Tax=Methylomonas sp. UP202 TaxID=3040943 RepID=UPI00247A52E5|nr:PRTRC system protein C [Methylomonas sp. UP202]WGS83916.1 PRTRC system protein C [Methylomonas sp. UP202]